MTLRITTTVDPAEWDAQVEALGAPVFHSTVWARYSTDGKPNLEPLFCSILDDDAKVRGVALLFRQGSANPFLRRVGSRVYSDAHPWVDDAALFPDFVRQIEEHAGGSGALELTLGSFGTPGHRDEIEQLGYQLKDRYEFVLPLRRTDEEILSAMERRRRRTLQKARDAGVTIEILQFEEGIPELRRLQQFTKERLEQRGAIVDFGTVRPPEQDAARELVNAGRADLVGARHDGRLVSVSLYTKMSGLVYSTLAGHAPEAYQLNAYTLLLWTVLRRYREEGHQRLNIGGVPAAAAEETSPDHGLYLYKAGMGGAQEACSTGSKILKPARHKAIERARALLRR